jgi:hypothetical protein
MKAFFLMIVFLFFVVTNLFSQFRAVYIPEDKLPFMKMDGDTSDWKWFPDSYWITKELMYNLLSKTEEGSSESWGCLVKVAWSDIENKVFILATTFDDIIVNDNPRICLNDCMQLAINPNNYGSGYRKNEESYYYTILEDFILNANDSAEFIVESGPKWLEQKNSNEIKGSITRTKDEKGRFVTIYELSISLWDKWSDMGPGQSLISDLYPFKKVHLGVVFNDADKLDNSREGAWANQCGIDWYLNVDHISGFILDAPIEKGISWNNVHRMLEPE